MGRSPLQGSGLMGVPLTQAVGLGLVRSPLWGSKTTSDLARLGFVRLPRWDSKKTCASLKRPPFASLRAGSWGSRTTADFARLGFLRSTLHFPLKRGTKPIAARCSAIHLAGKRPNHPCARGRWRCCRFVALAAEPRNPISYRQEIDDGEAIFFLPAGNSARISLTLLLAYVLA